MATLPSPVHDNDKERRIPRTNFYKSVIIVIIIHFVKLTHTSPLEWSVHKYCGLIRLWRKRFSRSVRFKTSIVVQFQELFYLWCFSFQHLDHVSVPRIVRLWFSKVVSAFLSAERRWLENGQISRELQNCIWQMGLWWPDVPPLDGEQQLPLDGEVPPMDGDWRTTAAEPGMVTDVPFLAAVSSCVLHLVD